MGPTPQVNAKCDVVMKLSVFGTRTDTYTHTHTQGKNLATQAVITVTVTLWFWPLSFIMSFLSSASSLQMGTFTAQENAATINMFNALLNALCEF